MKGRRYSYHHELSDDDMCGGICQATTSRRVTLSCLYCLRETPGTEPKRSCPYSLSFTDHLPRPRHFIDKSCYSLYFASGVNEIFRD